MMVVEKNDFVIKKKKKNVIIIPNTTCYKMINSITRSLLSKNAAPVYKLINDIFGMISKFETRLISHGWQEDKETGLVTHPMFFKLQQSYQAFRQCIEFLFSGMCFCCILYYLLVL